MVKASQKLISLLAIEKTRRSGENFFRVSQTNRKNGSTYGTTSARSGDSLGRVGAGLAMRRSAHRGDGGALSRFQPPAIWCAAKLDRGAGSRNAPAILGHIVHMPDTPLAGKFRAYTRIAWNVDGDVLILSLG
ncbi:hypothetical protein EVAR_66560_1 [Eumeta japonica]|uniref:Uncharacterized protein n=1 Tax=Eumeta variegata TaxID=151549 RepID=A0A4C1ZHJ8_EUMVA|nr:hypothetical protein EVAR_66560_1 [Eumeta japonica]